MSLRHLKSSTAERRVGTVQPS